MASKSFLVYFLIIAILIYFNYDERSHLKHVINHIKSITYSSNLALKAERIITCKSAPAGNSHDFYNETEFASIVEKCYNDRDSTLTSTTYITGDYETRKKDWLSSCYPIEISTNARSFSHCVGAIH